MISESKKVLQTGNKLLVSKNKLDSLKYENNRISWNCNNSRYYENGIPKTQDENIITIIQKITSVLNVNCIYF